MLAVINLAILSSNSYYQNIDYRKNIIENNCEFNTIRFRKLDVECNDLGKHVSYCKNSNLANEFVVNKELGVGNQEVFSIKPLAMWEEINNDRYKMADFYYNFHCDKESNNPKLSINILPTAQYDISFEAKLIMMIMLIITIVMVMCIIGLICPCFLEDSGNFSDGLLFGFLLSDFGSSGKRRTYCE